MKKRIINKILSSVHKSLCESIKDKKVKELVKNNTIITGGCITSMLLQEDVNDYDLYFRNKETVLALAKYYVEEYKKIKLEYVKGANEEKDVKEALNSLYVKYDDNRIRIVSKSRGVDSITDHSGEYEYFETVSDENKAEDYIKNVFEALKKQGKVEKYVPILLTNNAITLSNNIQIIIRFYGEPEEIHKNYDFVHVTNYWTSWGKEVVTNTSALESLLAKELKYTGSLYPICSLFRVRKFLKRGWSIHAGQLLKMAFQINELNLEDYEVLEEQLTGVDVAYFQEVIDILRKDVKNGKTIDATYLAQVIDKLIGE